MSAVRKITVHVPVELIEGAQLATGAGVTETVRAGLERLRQEAFCRQMLALKGKVDFTDFDLDELREDKVYDWESGPA